MLLELVRWALWAVGVTLSREGTINSSRTAEVGDGGGEERRRGEEVRDGEDRGRGHEVPREPQTELRRQVPPATGEQHG